MAAHQNSTAPLRKLRRDEGAKLERGRRLSAPLPVIPALPPEPGVYEDEIHPPGERWFKIVMPSGNVGIVHFPEELCDEALVGNLWKRYWSKSRRKLKII